MSLVVSPSGQTNFGTTGVPVVVLPVAVAAGTTYTVSLSQSGSIFNIPAQPTGVLTITLPPVAASAGFSAKFILTAIPGGNSPILTATGANILCSGQSSAGWSAPTAGRTTITFVSGTALVGDRAELTSNGAIYFGQTTTTAAAAAITYA